MDTESQRLAPARRSVRLILENSRLKEQIADYERTIDEIRSILHEAYVNPTRMPNETEKRLMRLFVARGDSD